MDASDVSGRVFADALDPRGTAADRIDDLWWLLLALGVVVFLIFVVLLILASRRPGGHETGADRPDDDRIRRSWIAGGGVAMPSVVIGVVLVATVVSLADPPLRAGDETLVVEVTGHQWWWEVTYPQHGITTANEVHIPAGEPVELRLRSADVVHSLWVPALAGKMDLLPERTNTQVIDADRPGRYPARCAEFCGLQHARMELTVVAHDGTGFRSWILGQQSPAPAAAAEEHARARNLFATAGCADCHTIDGTDAEGEGGPDLSHVASRHRIAAGSLEMDPMRLTEWITDPHAVKTGVRMPAADLDQDEIATIVRYLEALE